MKTRLVTAGAGAAWEAALVQACQQEGVPAEVLHRCYDLGDLLAVAAAGQAEAAVVAAGIRWLDHDALARLAAPASLWSASRPPATRTANAGCASSASTTSAPTPTRRPPSSTWPAPP